MNLRQAKKIVTNTEVVIAGNPSMEKVHDIAVVSVPVYIEKKLVIAKFWKSNAEKLIQDAKTNGTKELRYFINGCLFGEALERLDVNQLH